MTTMTGVCSEYSTPVVVHRGRALSNLILIRVYDIDPVHFSAASMSRGPCSHDPIQTHFRMLPLARAGPKAHVKCHNMQ
jgi:hypothetical protein